MDAFTLVLAATAVAGLYMAWNIGANDVANAMGTSVGSGALTLRSAVFVAAIFELSGAMLAGGRVTETIADGIVDFSALSVSPLLLAGGMACSLVAAALWIHAATSMGFPVSTTHSIVGAVLGFGLSVGGFEPIDWAVLGRIVASWLLSPLLGGVSAYFLFRWLQRVVFENEQSTRMVARLTPLFVFVIVVLISTMLLTETRPPLGLGWTLEQALPVALGAAAASAFVVWLRAAAVARNADTESTERLFGILQIVTACFIAFAHGSNDVANAAGPVAAAFRALDGGDPSDASPIPANVLMIGACGIVLGLSTYGFRVMATIGQKITALTPSRGFAAEFAAAITIATASKLALPVSTTNVLVGAVVGVGLNRSMGALNLRVLQGIGTSWVVAVPATALMSALLTALLRLLF